MLILHSSSASNYSQSKTVQLFIVYTSVVLVSNKVTNSIFEFMILLENFYSILQIIVNYGKRELNVVTAHFNVS